MNVTNIKYELGSIDCFELSRELTNFSPRSSIIKARWSSSREWVPFLASCTNRSRVWSHITHITRVRQMRKQEANSRMLIRFQLRVNKKLGGHLGVEQKLAGDEFKHLWWKLNLRMSIAVELIRAAARRRPVCRHVDVPCRPWPKYRSRARTCSQRWPGRRRRTGHGII